MKSTNGITWRKDSKKIINHIYPDVDRSIGLEIPRSKIKSMGAYPKNFLGKPYAEYEEPDLPSVDTVGNREKTRIKWLKKMRRQNIIVPQA